MSTESLACALIGHLVGDYLLQNDWMALNKKRDAVICCIHAWIWTLSVLLFSGWWSWGVVSVLFLTHFFQDHTCFVTWFMRLIGQRTFMKSDDFDVIGMRVIPGLGPWSIIVVDNVWHILTIWAVWKYLL